MKAINFIKKYINSLFNLPKEALETWNYPEYILRLQKERKIWQTLKINLVFFVKNPCRSQ